MRTGVQVIGDSRDSQAAASVLTTESGANLRGADILSLAKPRIAGLAVFMAAAGMALGPHRPGPLTALATLAGTALAAGGASALNMYLERESDRLMFRTRHRPLPAGRVPPRFALAFGAALALGSVTVLALAVNPLTALLGAVAITFYAFLYTPLKRRTPYALHVGTVPGAMPPLIGWTAASGALGGPGLVLFAIMLLWQVPHFMAIAIYCRADYGRAGIRCYPVERGIHAAIRHAILYAGLLVPVSLIMVPLGVAGWFYATAATVLGVGFAAAAATAFERLGATGWAKRLFHASLIYLPALSVALLIDVSLP
ncbi:MAG: protoheme IX farnesyltransferase [Candidatus Schekmanbacteria bacterium]|nr:protoheme IX farnesyltransferase [Candidatus Schekmanbacteria bacterium]